MQNTNEDKSLETIIANLHIVRDQARELELQAEELEKRLNLARGTGDVTEQAKAALKEEEPPQHVEPEAPKGEPKRRAIAPQEAVRERVESVLRNHSLNVAQLAKESAHSLGRVSEALKELRKEKKVANVGTADFPIWTLRIGDHTTTPELIAHIKRLITERPMSTQELVDVTGARMTRVSGAIVHLQRNEKHLLNLGTARRARWLLVGDQVKFAKLPVKGEVVQ